MGSSCMKLKRVLPGGTSVGDKARTTGQRDAQLRRSVSTIVPDSVTASAGAVTENVHLQRTEFEAGINATGKELLPTSSDTDNRFAVVHPWNHGSDRRGGKAVIFEISDFYPAFKSQCQLQHRPHVFKETLQLTKYLRSAGVAALDVQQNSTMDEVKAVMTKLATDTTTAQYNCLVFVILTRGVLTLVRTPDIGDDFLPFYDGFIRRSDLIEPVRKSPHCAKMPVLFMFEGAKEGWLSDPLDVNNVALLMPTVSRG